MNTEDDVFRRLKRSPWRQAWDDFILSGNDDGNHHVLERHGWTIDEFITHGLENGYIEKDKDE
jgi:hypothetical protein